MSGKFIINDILDINKIEAGKMTIEKIDFSLDDILANLSSLFMFQIEEKGLELLNSLEGVSGCFIDENNQVSYSKAFKHYLNKD